MAYRILILSDKYHLSLPTAILLRLWTFDGVAYFNTRSELTRNNKHHLSDKILAIYKLLFFPNETCSGRVRKLLVATFNNGSSICVLECQLFPKGIAKEAFEKHL
jgi:hypothetical protein